MRLSKIVLSLVVFLLGVNFASAQVKTKPKPTPTPKLSTTDISSGLKEALFKGVKFAVDSLGREDGFLGNARVRIPLPGKIAKMEKTLRAFGQGKRVDEFVVSMNRAAEKAVPVAIDVFLDAIKQMTFDDARKILFSGQDDSATQFFRRTSENTLRDKFRPLVEEATTSVGVTQKYKEMIGRYGFIGKAIGEDASDLDGYVTQKALDGLFLLVADEEKKIRKDPIGRTTSLLRKVFGGLIK